MKAMSPAAGEILTPPSLAIPRPSLVTPSPPSCRTPSAVLAYDKRGLRLCRRKGDFDRRRLPTSPAPSASNPKFAEAYFDRGNAFARKRRATIRRLPTTLRSSSCNPAYAQAYLGRRFAYQAKARYDKVIADCTEAIRLRPEL